MKKRRKLIVGNWKMNPMTLEKGKDTFKAVKKAAKGLARASVVVCPPYLYLTELAKLSKGEIGLGVQNVSTERSGSYTGEVSADQAASAGAEYAIVGHSERRAMGESDAVVAKKVSVAIQAGMKAILCVGERERDEAGLYLEHLSDQLRNSLHGIAKKEFSRVIIAYEPVWAVGRPDFDAMNGKDLYETNLYLRKVLTGVFGKETAFAAMMLYGGSVNWKNAEDIVKNGEVDGLLVGRQSLEPEGFKEVLSLIDSI